MSGIINDVLYIKDINVNGTPLDSNGTLIIGGTSGPQVTTLTAGTNVTITPGDGTITIAASGGGGGSQTLTGNSGVAAPSGGNINAVGSGSITTIGSGATLTISLTGLTSHDVLVGAGTDTITKIAPSATSGVPLISQGSTSDPTFGTAVVAGGGTGNTTFTAYSVICAGTTATGIFQNVSGLGSSGQVLTSNGAAALPTWQPAGSGSGTVTNVSGTANQVAVATGTTTPVISLIGPYTPSTYTAHGVLIGEGTSSIVALAAGTSGQVLQSGGAASDPAYSTSTYPSTATGTGTILRADGTNWTATTSTYPNTNAVSTLLYASSSNVMSALATSNNGVLITSASGVPSWLAAGTTGQVLTATTGSPPSWGSAGAGTVTSVTGTANQIDVATGTTTPVISLDAAITTPGSLTTTTTLTATTLFKALAGQVVNRTTTATSYSVLTTDYIVAVTSTSAARTITLPASPTTNQIFVIKDESGAASINNISIVVSGGANIDGTATLIINTNYGAVSVYWNGSQYFAW